MFRLSITARDFDIVFTIRDRTGSEYSFNERSSGLKYFLSYLVQFLIHIKERSGPGILLMDEPDAYLSNQGQQDLVRMLHEFTLSTESAPGGQVLYVTHSPFMIDKNRADRIRVLDKGSDDEGVRVVHDVGRNHFEPLRTAMGSFVGETAFIGNCNVMVEGVSDQVYLAGMSELLGKNGHGTTERFDLNQVTLVPAGSAEHIPYMAHLARGRDSDKPAVVVLLDGDKKGNEAVNALKKFGARNKELVRSEYILQINQESIPGISSERPDGPLVIEDLVPVEIGLMAARSYLEELGVGGLGKIPDTETVTNALVKSKSVLKTIQEEVKKAGINFDLNKIGFARHVVLICEKAADNDDQYSNRMKQNYLALLSCLTKKQRDAEREREVDSLSNRIGKEKKAFIQNLNSLTTKEDVSVFLERIEAIIDETVEGAQLIIEIREIRRDFKLDDEPYRTVEDLCDLESRINRLQYVETVASQDE